MSADDLLLGPATAAIDALRRREVSAVELLDATLARVERVNPTVNAVVTFDTETARTRAAAIDAARAAGGEAAEALGPLAGLPITIKDALETAGMRSTGGAVEMAGHVPTADAPVVAAVRHAGAVIYGKTNLPRWSGDIQSFNDMFGTTVNPWNAGRVPGGSSGGAAAAVATGMSSFEIGTDIGGSIRVPSSFCGVWGHKPSFGLVPSLGYLDHELGGTIEADVNVIGPIARSVDDLELLLDIVAGPTPERATAWRVQLPAPRHADGRAFRVAAWLDDPGCPVSADVAAAMDRVVVALESAGISVDRTARPTGVDLRETADLGMELIGLATTLGMPAETFEQLCATDFSTLDPTRAHGLGRLTRRHRDWLVRHRSRNAIRARWAEFFTRFDVLLAPVCVLPPFEHQQDGGFADRSITVDGVERPYYDLIRWTSFFGMAYLPVTVPPIGRTDDGLPIGLQVVGPYLEDRTCLAFARTLAEAAGTGYEPPPVARLDGRASSV